jgi:hypothetical protein
MRQERHVIDRYLRTRRWRGLLGATRILAGLTAVFLGVALFLTDPRSAAVSEAARRAKSLLLTYSSLALVAVGFVIMVGPDKVNEIARRGRH